MVGRGAVRRCLLGGGMIPADGEIRHNTSLWEQLGDMACQLDTWLNSRYIKYPCTSTYWKSWVK